MNIIRLLLAFSFSPSPSLQAAIQNNIQRLYPQVEVRIRTLQSINSKYHRDAVYLLERVDTHFRPFNYHVLFVHQDAMLWRPTLAEEPQQLHGFSQTGGNGIVTTSLLLKDNKEERLTERLIKVILHELSHIFALHHCAEPRCFMNVGNLSLQHLDSVGFSLCPAHQEELKARFVPTLKTTR